MKTLKIKSNIKKGINPNQGDLFGSIIPISCPTCGNNDLGKMPSQGLKYCPDCQTWIRYKAELEAC